MKKHSADKIMEFTHKLVIAEKSKNEIKKQQVTGDLEHEVTSATDLLKQ